MHYGPSMQGVPETGNRLPCEMQEYLAYSKWRQERNERSHKARGIEEGFYNAAIRRRRKKER